MNNIEALKSRKKSGQVRLTRNSKIFKTIIHAIQEKKGENIISLDLRKIPEAVADFFIICQASNNNQLRAIADYIEKDVKENCDERPFKHEGRQAEQWIFRTDTPSPPRSGPQSSNGGIVIDADEF